MDSTIGFDLPDGAIMGQYGNFLVPVHEGDVVKPQTRRPIVQATVS